MRSAHPQRRVGKPHAIIRLDVMRPISKTVPTLVLLSLAAAGHALSAAPAAAQAPPVPGKAAKAKAKPEAKATPPAAPQPAAEPAPTPVSQPVAVAQPMAEETEHVSRYDVAIAAARDHPLASADATALREAMAA